LYKYLHIHTRVYVYAYIHIYTYIYIYISIYLCPYRALAKELEIQTAAIQLCAKDKVLEKLFSQITDMQVDVLEGKQFPLRLKDFSIGEIYVYIYTYIYVYKYLSIYIYIYVYMLYIYNNFP
jgi:hypothetical protein